MLKLNQSIYALEEVFECLKAISQEAVALRSSWSTIVKKTFDRHRSLLFTRVYDLEKSKEYCTLKA